MYTCTRVCQSEYLTTDVADTLRYLLAGSGEITLENIEVYTCTCTCTGQVTALGVLCCFALIVVCLTVCVTVCFCPQLMSRSPNEVYEILSLTRCSIYMYMTLYIHIMYVYICTVCVYIVCVKHCNNVQ